MLTFCYLLIFLFFAAVSKGSPDIEEEYVLIQPSCIGLKDNTFHYFQLSMSDASDSDTDSDTVTEGSIVRAQCSNDYIIIDYSIDSDWKNYFSTWVQWHRTIAGASKNDLVNWHNWFLPDSGNYNFEYKTSYDCNTCDNSDVTTTLAFTVEDSIGYYMNATSFGCFSVDAGVYSCDMTYDGSNVCNACTESKYAKIITTYFDVYDIFGGRDATDKISRGNCYVATYPVDQATYQDWDLCGKRDRGEVLNPSIGIGGDHCVCIKPKTDGTAYEDSDDVTDDEEEKIRKKKRAQKAKEAKEAGKEENENEENEETSENIESYKTISRSLLNEHLARKEPAFETNEQKRDRVKDLTKTNTVYLTQSDFETGTYRITESGTYVISEDIIFDFNAPDYSNDKYDPNEEGIWWPKEDQSDEYVGGNDFSGPYFLGFFAGISIETSNVILDLNGFELKMSKEYYYQQPFWATIELSNQVFLPGQGVGFFGPDPIGAKNVVVKNGNLGLSSHHCIHGLDIENVVISDINCYDFTTHGIQINGFKNLVLDNVDVGNNIEINYLNADYSNMRVLLPRLRYTSFDYGSTEIQFLHKKDSEAAAKVWTYDELLSELELQLHYAYKYVIKDGDLESLASIFDFDSVDDMVNDESFKAAINLFVNFVETEDDDNESDDFTTKTMNGMPFGGVMYGLLLKNSGSAIPSYFGNSDSETTKNLVLKDVKIHDLTHETYERTFIMPFEFRVMANPLNANIRNEHFWDQEFIDAMIYLQDEDKRTWSQYNPDYTGTIYSDILLALGRMTENDANYFEIKGSSSIRTDIMKWAIDGNVLFDRYWGSPDYQCNGDAMIHIDKGTIGLRLSGVDNVQMSNVEVYNLHEFSTFGSEDCGQYETSHFRSMQPYSYGYNGNFAQGISTEFCTFNKFENVKVNSIISETGPSYGIQFFLGTTLNFDETDSIYVSNIIAGRDEEQVSTFMEESVYGLERDGLPNMLPKACGIKTTPYSRGDYSYDVYINNENSINLEDIVMSECVSNTFTVCDDENLIETNLGSIVSNEECNDISEINENVINSPYKWRKRTRRRKNNINGINMNFNLNEFQVEILVACLVFVSLAMIVKSCYQSKNKNLKEKYGNIDNIDNIDGMTPVRNYTHNYGTI